MKGNTMECIRRTKKRIQPRYDIWANNINAIYQASSEDPVEMITNSFVFGYAHGFRAAKNKRR